MFFCATATSKVPCLSWWCGSEAVLGCDFPSNFGSWKSTKTRSQECKSFVWQKQKVNGSWAWSGSLDLFFSRRFIFDRNDVVRFFAVFFSYDWKRGDYFCCIKRVMENSTGIIQTSLFVSGEKGWVFFCNFFSTSIWKPRWEDSFAKRVLKTIHPFFEDLSWSFKHHVFFWVMEEIFITALDMAFRKKLQSIKNKETSRKDQIRLGPSFHPFLRQNATTFA